MLLFKSCGLFAADGVALPVNRIFLNASTSITAGRSAVSLVPLSCPFVALRLLDSSSCVASVRANGLYGAFVVPPPATPSPSRRSNMPGNALGGAKDPEFLLMFNRASPASSSSFEESDSSLSRGGGGGESAREAESEAESRRPLSSSLFNAGGD